MYVRPPLFIVRRNTTITVLHDSPTLHPSETTSQSPLFASIAVRSRATTLHCYYCSGSSHNPCCWVQHIHPTFFSTPLTPLNPSHQLHFIPLHPMTYITVPRCLTPPLQRHGTAVSIDQLRLDGFFVCTHPKCPYRYLSPAGSEN